ncbi:hypothetical protein AVEN_17423-1 [Araneus ventricosus]|uniref:Uncharacterized protein n=1 Tax=Araneus ventricosus TaxID=182803 RepID=A0A4Y2H2N8_ARAVE|nr:hypothetical protein AVEN_17423-1 [Araneus ventricosus]
MQKSLFGKLEGKGFILKNKKQISYHNIPSAIRPVPHEPGIPVPSPPDTVENIFCSNTESECEIDGDVDEVHDPISDEPKLFTQSELNDLVRDLYLSKGSAEVLGSRLKEKNCWLLVGHFLGFGTENKSSIRYFLKAVNFFIVTIFQAS